MSHILSLKKTKMLQLTEKYPEKRAFITGAASGLGLAMSQRLARDGWTVGMCDINEDQLYKAALSVQNNGGTALTYVLNVADRKAYKKVADEFVLQTKGIDLLVNNAGVGDGGLFEEYSLDNWEWMININQMGVLYGCHHFLPFMKQQGAGHIINTASAAAFAAAPRMGPYNASKAAVLAMSETLYTELKPHNIGVSVVMPVFFRSNIMQFSRGDQRSTAIGHKMIQKSRISAGQMAHKVLTQSGKNKLYIVEPFEAKFLYALRRWAPGLYNKMKLRFAKKSEEKALRYAEKIKKQK